MNKDSEVITVSADKTPSDLSPVFVGMLGKIPFKQLVIVFIIYIFISSDVFIKRILNNVDGAVGYNNSPTTKGTVITGVLLVLLVAISGVLIDRDII